MKVYFSVLVFFASCGALCARGVAAFDPAMAQRHATFADGQKWIDGKGLPLEGRAFENVDWFYDRLPSNVSTNVNEGVRTMKHHTSGMLFRFKTDSRRLSFKWIPYFEELAMDHMPATGVSGIDVYRYDESAGRWVYAKSGRIWDAKKGGTLSMDWTPGTPCLVNLPLYNGIRSFKLGVESNATVSALGPRASGVKKPVVFYGTSITHGGCASRPGLSFVNVIGRDLDVPVVNLGFSGSGRMELEMSDHLAAIDASCYVLDCLWNMNNPVTRERYEPFIRNLHTKRPNVPIVMMGRCDVWARPEIEQDRLVYGLYRKLKGEDPNWFARLFLGKKALWGNLHFYPKTDMYSGDAEGTVDGAHPNDHGMLELAEAYGRAVRDALW